MVARLIDFCGRNRMLVLILTAFLVVGGVWTIFNIRIDAIPDLSDVQAHRKRREQHDYNLSSGQKP